MFADSNFFAKSENKCELNAKYWNALQSNKREGREDTRISNHGTNEIELKNLKFCEIFTCTNDAMDYVLQNYSNADLLVTGSLHLIGAMLRTLEKHREA